jgi:beta-N-acetylhexosaminidase
MAAIEAIEAGHDILLLGGKQLLGEKGGFELSVKNVITIHQAICKAVKSGRLRFEKVKSSYEKIQSLKKTYL